MKILLIDDSPFARKMTKKIFPMVEFEPQIIEANGGKEGLELFDKEQPDIVLCDLLMVDMDGMEVLEKMREKNKTCFISILSSDAQQGRQNQIMERGANLFIKKPLNREKMEQMLNVYKKHQQNL